ncbi:hypothetical protein Tco_0157337 [Tanacetum coccineum]
MMTGSKFDIEKFDGKNDFALWQVRMKALLEQQGLAAALEELPAATIAVYDNVIQKKAFSALILCLGVRVLREITKETTAAGIWEKLETLYMIKSLANRLYLKKKLYTFNMHPGKSQSEHIDEFHKLVGDLAVINTILSDEDQTLLLLTSLPLSYDNFVETLLYGRDTLKLEDVLATLNSRELQKMTKAKGDGGEGLYPVYGYDSADVMMAMSVEELLDWIMDSRGSYHITYMRDYLVDFKEYDGNNILLGDGRECRGSTQQCMKSGVAKHLGVAWIHQRNGLVEETNMTLLAKWVIKLWRYGFNTGLQGVEFEVELHEDHTFEVEPHGNVDHVAGSQEVQTLDLIYYHLAHDRHQHSTHELFSYREESNKAAFAVAKAKKIYAHESLTFNNTVACEVISKWKAGLKDDMDARSDVYVLSNSCKKRSDDNDVYYWEYTPGMFIHLFLYIDDMVFLADARLRSGLPKFYNEKLVQTLLEGHFILSLEGTLSRDCDVEKNGKWSCIYAVGSQEYQVVCTRLDIASTNVGMLDKFDCGLQKDVHVFVDFDYTMGRLITVMEAAKEAIWLKGLAIESGFELKIVAGIATGALSKAIPGLSYSKNVVAAVEATTCDWHRFHKVVSPSADVMRHWPFAMMSMFDHGSGFVDVKGVTTGSRHQELALGFLGSLTKGYGVDLFCEAAGCRIPHYLSQMECLVTRFMVMILRGIGKCVPPKE